LTHLEKETEPPPGEGLVGRVKDDDDEEEGEGVATEENAIGVVGFLGGVGWSCRCWVILWRQGRDGGGGRWRRPEFCKLLLGVSCCQSKYGCWLEGGRTGAMTNTHCYEPIGLFLEII
jgi:hypothetical protein